VRALLSVWDKTGLAQFAGGLAALGWELISTGRTQAALQEAGIPATAVDELTGFPEILDGRVKTLHPRIHGAILARRDLPAHLAQLAEHGIAPIDLVAVNLYPFLETISARPVPYGALAEGAGPLPAPVQEAIEQIDIGGPALARAAAKNFEHVVVVTDPSDYEPVLAALRAGGVPRSMRARLAQKAFAHTAHYDAYVAQYLAAAGGERFAERVALPLRQVMPLSYGENPHQQAVFYRFADPRLAGPSLADLRQLSGDALSYNNLLDLDNAYAIVAELEAPAVAIVKHNNPCGVGTGATLVEAYWKAFQGDPVSAFGGVVAANRVVDRAMAEAMGGVLFWVLVAPGYDADALQVFTRISKRTGRPARSTRVVQLPLPRPAPESALLPGLALHYRQVLGGFLAQTFDRVPIDAVTFQTVSRRLPAEQELRDLRFAWQVVKHVRSNAVVFARDGAVVAVGAGQMSRIDAVIAATHVARRSLEKNREAGRDVGPATPERPCAGSVMATDGFFPFPDAVEAAAAAGATAIAHPGGARQDEAAIAAADRHGLAMVVTGYRHFRH
jgi:phosphoribosylaminoimidazolecarboxamide formyltransferase/IMP cyclohydrolase